MITPSHSLTAAQTVSPKLALDFTTASLDARVTLTRAAATGTRVNSSGFIETVAADTARFNYDPVTLACRGLLVEESRTNALTYSNDVNNAAWGKVGSTVGAVAVTSPDGTANAYKIIENSANSSHGAGRTFSVTNGATYTLSVFVQAAGRSILRFIRSYTTVPVIAPVFNLTTKTATGTGSPTIEEFAAGWFRCSATFTAVGTGLAGYDFIFYPTGTNTYVGDGTSGMNMWGSQFEDGAFPTTYIPNVATGTTTRNADVAVMTGANFSDWYSAATGTIRIDAISNAIGVRPIISVDDDTANNSLVLITDSTTPKFIVTQTGSEQANVTAGTITANATMFAYASYAANYFGIARPAARNVDTTGTVPTVDRLRIGANQAGAYLNGTAQKIQFWP